jgi:RecB family exonuclease
MIDFRVEGHHDFAVLEDRLAALVRETRAADPAGPLAPIAVVAPTRRLLSHLQTNLAEAFPGLLNVHFLHHDGLAREAAAAAGAALPRVLPDRVLDALVARLISAAGGDFAAYAARRPGCAAALRGTFADLREAGVDPAAAGALEGLGREGRDTIRLYAGYAGALAGTGGASDRAGMLHAALPHVASWVRRFRLIVHYGAYELIGINLMLLEAAARGGAPVVFLVPWHPSAPAYAHARRFWSGRGVPVQLPGPAAPPAPPGAGGTAGARLLGDRLPFLNDEIASPPPLPAGPVEAFHAQGAAAELREVALRILALVADQGVPLRRIGVVARSLEPYAPLLRVVFGEHGLPFVCSGTLPASREAPVQAAQRLARVALSGFERQPLMDLLRSGLARLDGADPGSAVHDWDRLSREFGVSGGIGRWTKDLPAWVDAWQPHAPEEATGEQRARLAVLKEARGRQARALAAAVRAIERATRPMLRADRWGAWADAMEAACRTLVAGFDGARGTGTGAAAEAGNGTASETGTGLAAAAEPGVAAVLALLDEMRRLDPLGVPFGGREALAYFEQGAQGAALPIGAVGGEGGPDNGGVRILDAMQARGLSFEALFLIGFNTGQVPRRAREDPFLGDGDRRLIRERLGAPLPIAREGIEEEQLLLAHLAGAARSRLTVSWQRADEAGKARAPSLALRELARLTHGRADLRLLETAARRVPGEPARAALEDRDRHRLLPPRRARSGAALQAGSPSAVRAALDALPPGDAADASILESGLRLLEGIESFSPADLRYDACVGGLLAPPAVVSVSEMETFGRCPQRWFFERALHASELGEIREEHDPEPADLGSRVHEVLRRVYGTVRDENLLERGGGTGAARRAVELLATAWLEETRDLAERLRDTFPIAWEVLEERWLAAIGRFLEWDLGRLAHGRAAILGVEQSARAALPLPGGASIELRGRFDRVVRDGAGGTVVADYKTARSTKSLRDRVSPTAWLKGHQLQMPLYVLLAERGLAGGTREGTVLAEILGIGPALERAIAREGEADPGAACAPVDAASLARSREGLLETLAVLDELLRTGRFPLNEGWWCEYCPFPRACRRTHAPTVERLASAAPLQRFAGLWGKSLRRPLLGNTGANEEEEGA